MTVLVVAEHDNTLLKASTLNTVKAAAEISFFGNGEVHVLVIGHKSESVAKAAADTQGVSKVIHADGDSLAHGLGLEVHEAPSFYNYEGNQAVLQEGMVFTVEPGLYYPERGFGVRVEDVVYCDEAGVFHSMSTFPKDLVLPMRG